jgi:RNA polymerase sigma-70 factor, ECF subfamily
VIGTLPQDATGQQARTTFTDATAADFARYVEPFVPKMLYLAERLGGQANRDDIVQEALINAWTKRSQFSIERGSLGGWLMAIVADQARKTWRRRLPMFRRVPDPPGAPVEDRIDLERAVGLLPPRQRMAVECHYFAGLTVAEMAAVMRCSDGTVKATLAHARRNMRSALEEPQ